MTITVPAPIRAAAAARALTASQVLSERFAGRRKPWRT